ncbi:MAG TPA: molybdopterin-dependent oxidoreductase [Thermoanaerobaculia bacterium]|jgi:anaerobic selenocysteine-containing dehydrogenase|nr:molybdopterin-dependent oxidoreductase [Thermoanaerobaculia bacterium]
MPEPTVAYRICPLCEACCGLEVELRDGRVAAIRGDREDVFSAGYLCPKGVALKELHEDPDRLRAPLVKRDGRFAAVSWEEAFAEIERRLPPILARSGRDAAALAIGNPAAHKMGLLLYVTRLARALGTRNVFSASTLDQMPKHLSSGLMFGHWLSIPVPDIERCDFLLMLGANPLASNGSLWTVPGFRGKARALQARGGRLVVVDPRRTETARLADRHLFIRPGSDVFFLLGLVYVLFDEGLVRLGALADHVNGVEAVREAVLPFAPERVADRCGIAAETIRELARTLAAEERAAVYGRLGTCTQRFGSLSNWLVDVINALTGHLDAPGGAMFPKAAAFAANTMGSPGTGKGVDTGRRRSRVSNAPEVYGELPMTCLAEEIETPGEGQVRALLTVAGNPVLSAPNGPRLAAALETLEFMVSVDVYVNETTRHADVILPGLLPFEESHYDVAFPQLSYRNHARYSSPVLMPSPDRPAEWEILLRLAAIAEGRGAGADVQALDDEMVAEDLRRRAGAQADFLLQAVAQWRGPERLLDLALRGGPYGDQFGRRPDGLTLAKVKAAPHGIDLGPLAPRVPEVLRTPSGKIELAPALLLEDLKHAEEDLAAPAPDLVVIGRRDLRSNNSWMHNLPVLAKGPQRCTALVHPADAARCGVTDAGPARLTGASGHTVTVEVKISDEVMPGVISLPHGWGHDLPGIRLEVAARRPGANLNALLDENLRDPLSGNAVLSGVPVRLEPEDA